MQKCTRNALETFKASGEKKNCIMKWVHMTISHKAACVHASVFFIVCNQTLTGSLFKNAKLCRLKQRRAPVHYFYMHYDSSQRLNAWELRHECSGLQVRPSVGLPQQCPAIAIANRISHYGNTKWLLAAVSGCTQPTLILIGAQNTAVQQNFLQKGAGHRPTVCRDVSTQSTEAQGCWVPRTLAVSAEKVSCALKKTLGKNYLWV